tara:strand:+ start:1232 stop:2986 length:1755 start_codon:yes stop_codon:yes gene_type:complete
MELHLLLLDDPMDPSSKMSAEQFESIKDDMLRAYDEAKMAKRDVKAEKRSWEYKKAFDQRSENELNDLESRVENLKDKRDHELKSATRDVTDVTLKADNMFSDIFQTFQSGKAELEAYSDAGKLSMAQGAFLDQIDRFFENVYHDFNDEFKTLRRDADQSGTASEFTDKFELASEYAESIMDDYYSGVKELQNSYTQHDEKSKEKKSAREAQAAQFEAEVTSIKQDLDAAEKAGDDEGVKKYNAELHKLQKEQSDRNFEYNVEDRRDASLFASLEQRFNQLIEDMHSKLSFIADAFQQASEDGSEIIFHRTGSVMTPEHLYSYAKNTFAEEDIKAAYAELESVTEDYNQFDAQVKAEAEQRLRQVNSGIVNLGSWRRDLNLAIKASDADLHAGEVASIDKEIEQLTNVKDKLENEITHFKAHKAVKEGELANAKSERAQLDPADPDEATQIAKLDAAIEQYEIVIETLNLEIRNETDHKASIVSDISEAVAMKEHKIAVFENAVQHVAIYQADYDRVKERVIKKQLEYSDFLVYSEDDRMQRINQIAELQEAVDAVDVFAVVIDFRNGNMGDIRISDSSDSHLS